MKMQSDTAGDSKRRFGKTIKYSARIGTGLLLMVLVFSCATVPGLREESAGTFIRIPFVRVLLDESTSRSEIHADDQFAVECLTGGQQAVYYSNRPVEVINQHGRLTVRNQSGAEIQSGMEEVNIIPRGHNNRIEINKVGYRGIIKILPTGQNLQQINIVYMEDYLRGVVPPEIGKRSNEELEAVKAQAVAART
jgi:hypothetical protein